MAEAWPGTEAKGVRDSPLPPLPCSPTWNSIDPQARMSAELTPVAWMMADSCSIPMDTPATGNFTDGFRITMEIHI